MSALNLVIYSIVGTISVFSILSLSLILFRIPIRPYWLALIIAGGISFHLNQIVYYVWGWENIEPILAVCILALILHIVLEIGILYSLMMSFIGSAFFTIFLGVVMLMTSGVAGYDLETLFYMKEMESMVRIVTCLFVWLFAFLAIKYRWGFTFVKGYDTNGRHLLQQRKLFTIFTAALLLFSIAYYAVTLHIMMILWIGLGLVVLLAIILYLLYKKEMEEN
jgi:hypothetical protein